MDKYHLRSTSRLSIGPLFFNIYLNDLFVFLEKTQICNYVDDTTIYKCGPKIKTILNHLERDALKTTELFPNSFMKLNKGECHLMILERNEILK